jgi:hypothetical protein
MCHIEIEASKGNKIGVMEWRSYPYKKADGEEKTVFDFLKTESTFEDLREAIRGYVQKILPHHDLAKWQDFDWAHLEKNFPP